MYCLRIFLLNTINISMFSLYMNYLSLITSSKQPSSFFFSYFFLFFFTFKSRSYIYSSSWRIGAYITQLTTNTLVILCNEKIIALLHSKQSIGFSMNLHTNLFDFFFVVYFYYVVVVRLNVTMEYAIFIAYTKKRLSNYRLYYQATLKKGSLDQWIC